MATLSKEAVLVYQMLRSYIAMYHTAPTLTEIGNVFKKPKSWAQYNVRILANNGYVITTGRKRGVSLTQKQLENNAYGIPNSQQADGEVSGVDAGGSSS